MTKRTRGSIKQPAVSVEHVRESGNVNITEKDFLYLVRTTARWFGWKTYHTLRSKGSEPGFVDLVLVKGNKVIFWECKTETGKIEAEQDEWLTALENVEVVHQVGCVRPRDWPDIEATLKGK